MNRSSETPPAFASADAAPFQDHSNSYGGNMHRPTRLALLSFTASFALLVTSRAGAEDLTDRQQIETAGRLVGKAIGMRDFATIEKYWSPQMLVNSPGNSILTREQVFASIRENKLSYTNYSNEAEAFHIYGDIAVMMGHETLTPSTGPESGHPLYRRYTDIWQRANGAWLLIARQATYTDETQVHYDKGKYGDHIIGAVGVSTDRAGLERAPCECYAIVRVLSAFLSPPPGGDQGNKGSRNRTN